MSRRDELESLRVRRSFFVVGYLLAAVPISIANSVGSLWLAWHALAGAALVPPASLALCAAFVVGRAWLTFRSTTKDPKRPAGDLANDEQWQTFFKNATTRAFEAICLDMWLIGGAYLIAWCAS